MARIYAIANQKGGVGKTTTVVNLSAYLAGSGRRVLVVDLDPQANATSALGFDKNQMKPSTYELLLDQAPVGDVRLRHDEFGLDLLPSHPALAGAEIELVQAIGREYRLQRALQETADEYDYILIDSPPSLGLLTVNALTAARDGVLIPVQCEYLPLEGLSQLTKTIHLVQEYLNPALHIRGVMMTMYDSRTNLSRQVVEEVRRHFPNKVFRTIIPRNIRLSEAPSFGRPINFYAPQSPGAVAYRLLATELLNGDRRNGGGEHAE
ncbi:Sporulation initiation inhibitor protein Soj [Candidatus Promineifilum breve]|uniref:Sporulation initiation inhibitor protein Soj n=1 Tax=Candidatus Promineifilum breve TaxID=1806508 RepID=A0A160T636_9CHLR|nr:AAA family ATPase [Candidatus Promineifilum breve]CUS05444.2 Sporulation initiation inhibitor protein Soj [Candidatus Promineifilum breve]